MMVNWLDFLRCPHTGSELQLEEGYLVSQQGGYRYPIVFGIPDLRLFDPPLYESGRRIANHRKAPRSLQENGL